LATIAVVAFLGACVSQRPAPVVDRSASRTVPAAPAAPVAPPATTREAKDGVYAVQRGDTLYSIAAAFGIDVRDLARWNELPDASQLRVGQLLRVVPPAEPAVATVVPVTPGGSTEVRPLPSPGGVAAPTPLPPPGTPAAPAPEPAPIDKPEVAVAPPSAPPAPAAPAAGATSMQWQWPSNGKVIDGFDSPRNKGVDISGTEGDPVKAAADGEVVHVGSALRGYGNLVIIRHPGDYVTAYGHNRKVLVQQGQQVKRGQQIAELGRSDADRPKLHFELRHQGKPLDPVKYLPPR
jgi:lipoprotein NlpD